MSDTGWQAAQDSDLKKNESGKLYSGPGSLLVGNF